MSNWDIRDLNLTGVDIQRAATTLPPGKYVCRTSDAKVQTNKAGGFQIVVKLTDVDGAGSVTDYITVKAPAGASPNAQKAAEIGRERLKALLTYGGHSNPDHPGDISRYNGLVVGVIVEQGEDWTDENGVVRKGGGKPKRNGAYFDPKMLGYEGAPLAEQPADDLNDMIPF